MDEWFHGFDSAWVVDKTIIVIIIMYIGANVLRKQFRQSHSRDEAPSSKSIRDFLFLICSKDICSGHFLFCGMRINLLELNSCCRDPFRSHATIVDWHRWRMKIHATCHAYHVLKNCEYAFNGDIIYDGLIGRGIPLCVNHFSFIYFALFQ